MPKTIHKLPVVQGQMAALATVMQRWSELCKRHAETEPSAALRWYLQGLADAHYLDAARIRELLAPTTRYNPPSGSTAFTHAYEALLGMLRSITSSDPTKPTEPL